MSVPSDVKSRVSGLARAERERYCVGEERPLAVLAGADLLQFGYSWLQEQQQS